ncbi:MAG: tetratricopeptide repeat protein [Methylophaga sp.]|nr:tetratricopeptide repeat protein [Methylophaga sp.]
MDIYASDEEKAEEIKRWWRENGLSVLMAVLLGIGAFFGGRTWLNYQQMQSHNAANIYQQVVVLLAEDRLEEAEMGAQELISNFRRTPYASFAAVEVAAKASDDGDLAMAQQYLQWAADNAKPEGYAEIARLRLARLKLSEGDYQAALDIVSQANLDSFASLYHELEGDIHVVMGNKQQAQQAYQTALSLLALGEPRQNILEMKLEDVAVANES